MFNGPSLDLHSCGLGGNISCRRFAEGEVEIKEETLDILDMARHIDFDYKV